MIIEVAASASMLITSISLLIWVIKLQPKSKQEKESPSEEEIKLDAATSLHRDLDTLRNTRFGRSMHPRAREFNRRG